MSGRYQSAWNINNKTTFDPLDSIMNHIGDITEIMDSWWESAKIYIMYVALTVVTAIWVAGILKSIVFERNMKTILLVFAPFVLAFDTVLWLLSRFRIWEPGQPLIPIEQNNTVVVNNTVNMQSFWDSKLCDEEN